MGAIWEEDEEGQSMSAVGVAAERKGRETPGVRARPERFGLSSGQKWVKGSVSEGCTCRMVQGLLL